jgi:hypothetical protein
VVGYVEQAALSSGTVREHMRQLTPGDLISEATPMPSVLRLLESRARAFVLVGSNVRGLVTRADMNKPPVRVYLFGLVSLLEMHLSFWIKDAFVGDSWKLHLKKPRLDAAMRIQRLRKARDHESDLFECIQFCDKRDLVLLNERLLDRLGLSEVSEAKSRMAKAEDLRNNLAHSQVDLCLGSTWTEVLSLVDWMEALVHESDQLVDQRANPRALDPNGD